MTTFQSNLDRMAVDAQLLLSKIPHDYLKINKNLDQLYHTIRKRGANEQPYSQNIISNNKYKLAQIGIDCGQIEQLILNEQIRLTTKKKEQETQIINPYAVALGSEYDINGYLNKFTEYFLFNMTDHVRLQTEWGRFDKEILAQNKQNWNEEMSRITSEYDKRTKEDPHFYPRLYSQSARLANKRRKQEISERKLEYFNLINDYVNSKYTRRDQQIKQVPIDVDALVRKFANLNKDNQEILELWKILGYQILAAENNRNEILKDLNREVSDNYFNTSLWYDLIQATCQLLEEEFASYMNMVVQQSGPLYYVQEDHRNYHVRNEIYSFIANEYLKTDFDKHNYIQKDEKGDPVWAVIYVYFRAGWINNLSTFLKEYQGNLKGQLTEFETIFNTYRKNGGILSPRENAMALSILTSGEENVDVFKQFLYSILAKHDEVPSEDLISRLGDYLWFTLKVVKVSEDEEEDQNVNLTGKSHISDTRMMLSKTPTLSEVQETILNSGPEHFNPTNRTPLAYVKTLFIVMAYNEALDYLKGYDEYYEEYIHFTIVLKESGLLNLKEYLNENKPVIPDKESSISDSEYGKAITDYAMTFSEKRPLESLVYLRLLVNQPDVDKDPRRRILIQTIADCIYNNNHISFFFDNTREAEKNAYFLKNLVGDKCFKDIVLDIARRYIKTNIRVSIRLLDLINAHEQVMRLVIDEEYEYLKKLVRGLAPESITPIDSVFRDIYNKYQSQDIINSFPKLSHAYDFVKRTQNLWTLYLKGAYSEAADALRRWNEKNILFIKDERNILNEFKSLDRVEQYCYFDLILVAFNIIKEECKILKANAKGPTENEMRLRFKGNQEFAKTIKGFYKIIKKLYTNSVDLIPILRQVDAEVDITTDISDEKI